MTEPRVRTLLMSFRQAIIILLGALEDYLEMRRSIVPRRKREQWSKTAEQTAIEKLYKSWEGKTVDRVTINDDWSDSFDITFTDGTQFRSWVAQEALHVEEKRGKREQ